MIIERGNISVADEKLTSDSRVGRTHGQLHGSGPTT